MSGSTISFSRGEDPLRADKLNKAFSERVIRSGDTMLGSFTLAHDPVVPLEAATKQYVDNYLYNAAGTFLPLSGGTLTGALILHADPAVNLQAATKHYVDSMASSGPAASTTLPIVDGTAAAGVATPYAREDHVHPTDTSRASVASLPVASSTTPSMNGVAAIGVGTTWARADHVHPVDTSRYAATNPSGYQTAAQVTTALTPYAPLASPALTGNPTAPTPTAGDNDTSIATTAFVTNAVSAGTAGVASFNTRTGTVTLTNADVTTVLPPSSTTPVMDGTATIGVGTTWARADHIHPTDTSRYAATNPSGYQTAAQVTTALAPYAPIAAPVFTGDARAVTPAVGDNDTSIATTAFVQAAVSTALHDVGRNLIHNALFTVAQRGAGPWTSGGFTYTADRWQLTNSLDVVSASIGTLADVHRTQIGDEAAKWFYGNTFTGNAGAGAFNFISQPIEDVRRLAGKTVTVSFYAAASAALKLGVSLSQVFGTGGSPSATVNVNGQSVTLTTSFARYSLTFTLPSSSGKTLGTNGNDNTQLWLWYSSGATNAVQSGSVGVQAGTINLWGVQLEIGSVATPLEKRDPELELRQCQRFYQVLKVSARAYASGVGQAFNTNVTFQPMRAMPTIVAGAADGSLNVSAATLIPMTGNSARFEINSAAAGDMYSLGFVQTLSADL